MSCIKTIEAWEVLDSRGTPTVAVRISLDNGLSEIAMVPSGASTGIHEALELRDGDPKRFFGKGVQKAIDHITTILAPALLGKDPSLQYELDHLMLALDGTSNKSKLGANAILGVSLALAKVAATSCQMPLYHYVASLCNGTPSFPMPMMNILNGGAHADNTIDFQEFMIRPVGFKTMEERIRVGAEIFHALKKLLSEKGFSTAVGDEGGFAPNLPSNEIALEYLVQAIEKASFRPGEEVTIAIDAAASFFYEGGFYLMGKKQKTGEKRTSNEYVSYLEGLCLKFPIDSIEDGLAEEDWAGWKLLSERLGQKIQLVGDDLFVTNPKFLQKGIDLSIANAILIKPNQIGTLSETLETIDLAKRHKYNTIISHRSGETEDTFIADLAVGTGSGQIKTGSLSRSDRTSKYNRLLTISQMYNKKRSLNLS